jgi:ATP-dependent DNA ligase
MEAQSVETLPEGDEWVYEPRWDGFRCLLRQDDSRVTLSSKSGESLTRYFPELVETALAVNLDHFILDGEIVIPSGKTLSLMLSCSEFIRPRAAVPKLARETPAILVIFDLLGTGSRPWWLSLSHKAATP